MQRFFDLFIDFVWQGVAAIFRFVQTVWMWAVQQVGDLLQVPWQEWDPIKLVVLTVIVAGVVRYLYKALWELWDASQKILAALATLLGVLIKTLPQVLIAGLIALAGVALLNNVDFSHLRRPSFLHTGASPADLWGSDCGRYDCGR
ncbi:MAG: hypothetical protein J2P50_07085 [Hyphomicrobiaceae bacterium]|nr:hypothetical protein [Hyphomicrobiaceae bacterium]